MKKIPKDILLGASVLFLLNMILKLLWLGSMEVAMDEPFSIWWAGHPVNEILKMLKTENNPPLHFLLLHYWIKVFGISGFSVRFPSALFSAATAVLIFLWTRRSMGFWTAFFAALFFTFSTLQMSFAHEARVYALFELLTVWNLILLVRISEAPGKKELLLWLLVCDILLVYAHYFGWIVVGLQTLWLLVHPVRKTAGKNIFWMFILLLGAYSINFPILVQRFAASASGTWVPEPQASELYGNINRFLNSRYVVLIILVLALISLLLFLRQHRFTNLRYRFRETPSLLYLGGWFLTGWLLMFLVSLKLPVFLDRYLLFLTPALYILLAGLFHHLHSNSTIKRIFLSLVAGTMLIFFHPNPDHHRRIKDVEHTIRELQKEAGSQVLISPDYAQLEFAYHYDPAGFKQYDSTTLRLQQQSIWPVRQLKDVPTARLDSAKTLIYLDCGTVFAFGQDPVLEQLNARYTLKDSLNFEGVYKISIFTK